LDRHTAEVLTLADRHRKIVARGSSPRYLATSRGGGYLVYLNNSTLFAIPFDLDKLETRGTAVPVLTDVASQSRLDAARPGGFDFSPAPAGHGTFVYRRASGNDGPLLYTLEWVDPTGKREPLRAKPGEFFGYPRLSPDGKRVALLVRDAEGGTDIWVYDQQRDAMTRLTFDGEGDLPIWSPDGQYVLFYKKGSGIIQARADGASQPQALIGSQSALDLTPSSFTPDGKRLAYADYGAAAGGGGKWQIWTVPLEDQGGRLKAGTPEQFLKSSFGDTEPAFSPDGRWLAYVSNESGKDEEYVRAFPLPSSGQGGKWQISNNGGTSATWPRNGHDLVYRSGGDFMAASYTVKGDAFVAEKPRVWIAKLARPDWDLAPDGKRVLVLAPVESADAPKQEHEVVFLQNFFDYLRQRVPVGK
jgi:serine/threonine-protein kinase